MHGSALENGHQGKAHPICNDRGCDNDGDQLEPFRVEEAPVEQENGDLHDRDALEIYNFEGELILQCRTPKGRPRQYFFFFLFFVFF